MKRRICLALALLLVVGLVFGAVAENKKSRRVGVLSLLNATEEDYEELLKIRQVTGKVLSREGCIKADLIRDLSTKLGAPQVTYYDSLDAMMMASNAGEIDVIETLQSVAEYICANNDGYLLALEYDLEKERTPFVERVMSGISRHDLSFMMMEDHAGLCAEFNAAISAMKEDGTLDRLVQEQIKDLIAGGEISPIKMEKIDGAPTITVAVTGCLPPMDYVDAQGRPAGFNTAVLAEISKRIGKNIDTVVVDSMGRAAALASGAVDAVFWTRGNSSADRVISLSAEDQKKEAEEFMSQIPAKGLEDVKDPAEAKMRVTSVMGTGDRPEGTVVTDPYFSDLSIPVITAKVAAEIAK
jgi:ABC-type amino acid transport substrate-binding protein